MRWLAPQAPYFKPRLRSCLVRERGQVRIPEVGIFLKELHPAFEELATSTTKHESVKSIQAGENLLLDRLRVANDCQ